MMERWPADPRHITMAVNRLRSGAVVSFPTDTLYAVAARAADPDAVARLYAVKRRPGSQPVIWLVADRSQVEPFARVTPQAVSLMERFWPGPLTLVLPAESSSAHVGSAGEVAQPTLAVRAPNHPVALRLLSELGEAVASSSANRAGAAPPPDADAVIEGIGDDLDLVLDGGRCQIGVASTILDLTRPEPLILREGAISASTLGIPSASGGGLGGG